MKKYMTHFMTWIAFVCGVSTLHMMLASSGIDHGDDFRFALAVAEESSSEEASLMSEVEIAAVFKGQIKGVTHIHPNKMARHLIQLCSTYRFDPAFILSMVQAESGFRTDVVSSVGAIGLMQLMPSTATAVAKRTSLRFMGKESLLNPMINLSLGVAYLFELRERYRGSAPYFHVAAYNLGPAKLDSLRRSANFKPVQTRAYYEKIRRGVSSLKFYRLRGVV